MSVREKLRANALIEVFRGLNLVPLAHSYAAPVLRYNNTYTILYCVLCGLYYMIPCREKIIDINYCFFSIVKILIYKLYFNPDEINQ